jgi:hypothetical protein
MHRLIAILLIPFFVVGNCLAHAHGSAAHRSTSPGRAHIHVASATQHKHSHESHGHSHHDHGHSHGQEHASDDSKPAPVEKPVDHESDALYVTGADFMVTISARIAIKAGSCAFVETVVGYCSGIRPPSRRDRTPLDTITELPLYLLYAALRL